MRKVGFRLAFHAASIAAFLFSMIPCAADEAQDQLWGDRFRLSDDREAAMPSLRELVVEDFEGSAAVAWAASMPYSDGVAETKIARSEGAAGGTLGFRVLFMRRSRSMLDLRPPRPIRIEHDCRGFSVRAYGNGIPHELRLLVLDYYGEEFELSLGSLGFLGWKKLEIALPRRDGGPAYSQDDRHYRDPSGLRISGFRVVFDPEESYGEYISYLDDLGAVVDGEGPEPPLRGAESSLADDGASAAAATPPASSSTVPSDEGIARAKKVALAEITRRIAASMTYPEAARLRGIEGSMSLSFRVGKDGSLLSSRVDAGSGSEILDRAGLELLAAAFPVPNDSGLELEMSVPVVFRLED